MKNEIDSYEMDLVTSQQILNACVGIFENGGDMSVAYNLYLADPLGSRVCYKKFYEGIVRISNLRKS